MSASVQDTTPSRPAILESGRWALLFRRAWWGNRLLLYMLLVPMITSIGLLLGYPFQVIRDRADFLLRPTSLHGLMAAVVAAVVFRHIGRTSFHFAPVYAGLWLAYLIIIVMGPLIGNECVRNPTSTGCSYAIGGMAIEYAIWAVASAWFAATWLVLSCSTLHAAGSHQRVALFRTTIERKGDKRLMQRNWLNLLTGFFMLPTLGVIVFLHWQGYPEAQRFLFPATMVAEDIGLTADRGLIQLLVLATYTNYGIWPYAMALIPNIIDAALLLSGYRIARRVALVYSGRFWSSDRMPGILLLRSFSDDFVSVWPTSVLKRLAMGRLRLEEALGKNLFRHGNLIAIGQPGERLPKLGAYRIYLDDETWQRTVLAHMDACSLLVVIGGTSKWVRWELEQIGGSPNRSKLIYVLPPGDLSDRLARLALFGDALHLSSVERVAIEENAERILAIATFDDDRLFLCTGLPRHESDFQLATDLAIVAKVYRPS